MTPLAFALLGAVRLCDEELFTDALVEQIVEARTEEERDRMRAAFEWLRVRKDFTDHDNYLRLCLAVWSLEEAVLL